MHQANCVSFRGFFAVALTAASFTCVEDVCAQRIASVAGAGGVQCGDYLGHRKQSKPPLDALYQSWLNGYVSGFNQFSPNTQVAKIPSPDTLLAYVDKYCRENPLSPVKYAADTLIMELGGNVFTPGQAR